MAASQILEEEVKKADAAAAPAVNEQTPNAAFDKVESDKTQALTELEQTYGGMIDSTDKYYDDLINANQQWADKQAQLQQEQTDFTIEKLEQQKEQAQKDYIKEQSGAYADYKKQSSKYGVEAEKMASAGLSNTGYAESSQVSMYNTYQMRVATAREALAQAKLTYDNGIKEAMLANNAALAQIYADAYIKQAELALQGFQYKNQLVLEMADKKTAIDNTYYSRYQDVLSQINTENAMAEQIKEFNMNYELKLKEYEESIRQFNEEIARLKAQDDHDNKLELAELELKKNQLEEEKRQYDAEMKLKQQELEIAASTSGSTAVIEKGGTAAQTGGIPTGSGIAAGGEVTIDMQSVQALGYGNLTEAELVELLESGAVTYTQVGNKLVFSKVKPDIPFEPDWDAYKKAKNTINSAININDITGMSLDVSAKDAKRSEGKQLVYPMILQ